MAASLREMFIGRVPSTATTIYSPTSDDTTTTKARIQDANAVNTSAADVTLTCWIAPNGGSAGVQTVVLNAWTIPAYTAANGGRVDVPALRGRVIEDGGALIVQCSADGALTLSVDGMEFSTAV